TVTGLDDTNKMMAYSNPWGDHAATPSPPRLTPTPPRPTGSPPVSISYYDQLAVDTTGDLIRFLTNATNSYFVDVFNTGPAPTATVTVTAPPPFPTATVSVTRTPPFPTATPPTPTRTTTPTPRCTSAPNQVAKFIRPDELYRIKRGPIPNVR